MLNRPAVYISAIICLVLAGCARSPGVIKVAEDTYTQSMVGNFFTFSGASVAQRLEQENAEFCAKMGKRYVLIDSKYQHSGPATYASATTSFRCE